MKKYCIFSLCLGFSAIFGQLVAQEDLESIFTEIYDNAVWGCNEEGEGFSGGGSLVQHALPYMKFLEEFMFSNNIKSVLDVGCGDWTFSRYINWSGINYIGIDVVKSVIDKNQRSFDAPNITFMHTDGVYTSLPKTELLICKDVLQHLSNDTVRLFLEQVDNFKHCLITNDVNPASFTSNNENIIDGSCRYLDLTQPPFNVTGVKIFTYPGGDGTIKQVLYIEGKKK